MNITSYQPTVFNELDRVFRNFAPATTQTPWKFVEKDEAWLGQLDVPGFTKDEVSVNLDKDRVLVVEAKHEEGESERDFKREAISWRLRLPKEADAEGINAKLADGVLQVTIPKTTPDSLVARRIELN